MRILYIHQYFKTPEDGGSIRSYLLARKLVENGNHVEMVTAHNKKSYLTKNIDGINVHYLPIQYDNKLNYLKRVLAFVKFVLKAFQIVKKLEPVDLSYVMTTPLSTGIIALANKKLRGIPYIFEVGDLWPEVPIQMRIIRNPLIKWSSRKLESLAYKNASAIVALSSEIKEFIEYKHPDKRIEVIPNISLLNKFKCNFYQGGILKVLYCGTISTANHLEYLIELADMSQTKNLDIHFTIAGDGKCADEIKEKSNGLSNVSFIGHLTHEHLAPVIEANHAYYVSFQNIPILHTGSPNKLFEGFAAGKLIISNLSGWSKKLLLENEAGIYHDPKSTHEAITKLKELMKYPEEVSLLQRNALELSGKFGLNELSNLQQHLINEVLN